MAGLAASDDASIRVIAWAGPVDSTAGINVPYAGSMDDPDVRFLLHNVEEVILVQPRARRAHVSTCSTSADRGDTFCSPGPPMLS